MKNTILIILGSVILASLIYTRIMFHLELDEFKTSISNLESENAVAFDSTYTVFRNTLRVNNPKVFEEFEQVYNSEQARLSRDTVFQYLYLKKNQIYYSFSTEYLECAKSKAEYNIKEKDTQKKIEYHISRLSRIYGETFESWYPKLKDKLVYQLEVLDQCDLFFSTIYITEIKTSEWQSFEKFLIHYRKEIASVEGKNRSVQSTFDRAYNNKKRTILSSAHAVFQSNIESNKSQILQSNSVTKTFSSDLFGPIEYKINTLTFNEDRFNEVYDKVSQEQWANNSLKTGSTPYSKCYGSSNYVSDYYHSTIKVKSGNSDVVVIIKTGNTRVVRHAYIRKHDSFTFNLNNGTYNVYFYYGKGWSPYKALRNAPCNGGFVLSEDYGKDTYVSLKNHELTYTLTEVVNGNFNMQSASSAEAF